jgi:hypothetical protein
MENDYGLLILVSFSLFCEKKSKKKKAKKKKEDKEDVQERY